MKLRFVLAALLYLSISSELFAQTQEPRKRADGSTNEITQTGTIQQRDKTTGTAGQQAQATYGKLPLRFEANQGQIDGRVKFLARGKGYTLFLTPTESVFSVRRHEDHDDRSLATTQIHSRRMSQSYVEDRDAVRLRLVGANPFAQIEGLDELPGKNNYFIGSDPTKWRTNIATYTKVKYRAAYPGVDVVYHGNERGLEQDFVVAPGADPSIIELRIEGSAKLAISRQGDLILHVKTGDLFIRKPVVYQEHPGQRRFVEARYVLKGRHTVGFELSDYDVEKPLTIDPVLEYLSYLGGNSDDEGLAIAVDGSGAAYVTGVTYSSNFPVTAGAPQSVLMGYTDAIVVKIDPSKSGLASLVYSTYLGGTGTDQGAGIAVDGTGNAYVTGSASSGFPITPNAYSSTCSPTPCGSGFFAKLSADGSTLLYSTYLPQTGPFSVAVDSSGHAYVTGIALSSLAPRTSGAFQTVFGGGNADAFVAKIDPTLSGTASLVYSTYLGGNNSDFGNSIAVDSVGNAYVTGFTNSTTFPTTTTAFDRSCGTDGNCNQIFHVFVSKLNALGSQLLYSTYLGGSLLDEGNGIAVDATGIAYITGLTDSTDFPITPNAFQTSNSSSGAAFVAKIDPSQSGSASLAYSTFLGPTNGGGDKGMSIAVDASSMAYVTGWITGGNFPTTAGAPQPTAPGSNDAFVTKLDTSQLGAAALVYSTYLGGSNADYGLGVAVTPGGSAFVTGWTESTNLPTTPNAVQTTYGGGFNDAFVAKISYAAAPAPAITSISPTMGNQGDTISNFTVIGSNFDANALLSFSGLGTVVNSYGSRTSTQIVASITISTAAIPGTLGVLVTNPDSQQATLPNAFTILGGAPPPPPPSIISVTPTSGYPGQPISNFTVSGANFEPTSMLSFSTTDIAVTSYSSRTAAQIIASITIASNAALGARDVIVTNPDSQKFTLGGAFTILPVPTQLLPSTPVGPTQNTVNPSLPVSEPISTGNGNYYYQHTDFAIPGRGMPLVFQRSYNSLDDYSGPLGTNWTHSYNIVLGQPASGLVVIKWGDGHGETFTLSGGVYIPQPGVFSTLVQNPNGTFTLTRKDQTKFFFAAAGALTTIQDKNGNTIILTHGALGNLTQITDTVGRNLTLIYDATNRITQMSDPIGRTVSFQYDASNNLVKTIDPAGGITAFAYDANHRVISITQPNGTTLLQNTYDSSGRAISQTGGRGFTTTLAYNTPSPGRTTITDARGNHTVHTYDSSVRIVGVTDAAGGNTFFMYDGNNDRTSVTNQNGNTTAFAYVQAGNLALIADPLSETTAFSYDTKNNLLAATNAKGRTTSFIYDGNENLTKIQDPLGDTTTFGYDSFGELTSKTDARGNRTAYAYDGLGSLNRITDALGHSTTLAYDGISRLASITDPNSHTATAKYDALSRLTKIADPLGHQTQFAYDAVGNLLKITDANGHVTSYVYDATNNLVSVTDALGHVTAYSYDPANNRTLFTNAKGNKTAYAYDGVNRLTGITDPLSFATSYSYDAVGNVIAVTDAKEQTNQFAYDVLNRLLTIAYADAKTVAYAYDPDGNRTSMVDLHGTTVYSYDALDRLTSVTNPGAAIVSYSYDAVGNRGSLTYPDGKTVVYGYNALNRLAGATDWLGRNTAYTYDAASNLTNTAYPNGASIAFSYDAANRLLKVINSLKRSPPLVLAYALDSVGNRAALNVNGVTTNYTYDALNELLGAQLGPLKTTWAYDAVGNRLKQSFPPISTTYTYDADDRMLTAGEAAYTYDANGNETSVSRNLSGQPVTYQYDAANRLIAAVVGKSNSAFAYDGDGNRVSQSVTAGTYAYVNDVASALPVVLQESGPDGNIGYAYGLGLISESSAKFEYFYHYDGLGSVIALTNSSGIPSAAYVYDSWGNSLFSLPESVGTKNKFRFTGEALDPGTQLYYLRARYYDPGSGRFLTRDKFSGFVMEPPSLQRYSYVTNNPARFVDRSGLSKQDGTDTFTALLMNEQSLNTYVDIFASTILDLAKEGSGVFVDFESALEQIGQALKTGKEINQAQNGNATPDSPIVQDLNVRYNSSNSQKTRIDNAIDSAALSDVPVGTMWNQLSDSQKTELANNRTFLWTYCGGDPGSCFVTFGGVQ